MLDITKHAVDDSCVFQRDNVLLLPAFNTV